MTSSREALRDISHHKGPAKYLFALGYAGWGAGQLDSELEREDWILEPARLEDAFDPDARDLWSRVLTRP